VTLNQHLLKPINPKKLAPYNNKIVENGAVQIKPPNIYISLKNLIVPGRPEYKICINKILIPKLGVVCKIPDSSDIILVLYLL
jgi:hypothetical protein